MSRKWPVIESTTPPVPTWGGITPSNITMSFKLRSELEVNDSWHTVQGCDTVLEILMHALWETDDYVFNFSSKTFFDNVSPAE